MSRRAVILTGAKADFKEVKQYVKRKFGDAVWANANQDFKNTIQSITANPPLGSNIEQLGPVGYASYKQTFVDSTKVGYAFDDDELTVHMFIHTRRNVRSHLEKRLFAPR